MEHQMSEETKSKEENVSPYKKISNSQFEDLINSLQSRGIDLSPEDKSALISDGIVVSRTREKTRRGWTTDDGDKVFPSLSFKGLNKKPPSDEMEKFRSLYYELLKENVEVVTT